MTGGRARELIAPARRSLTVTTCADSENGTAVACSARSGRYRPDQRHQTAA